MTFKSRTVGPRSQPISGVSSARESAASGSAAAYLRCRRRRGGCGVGRDGATGSGDGICLRPWGRVVVAEDPQRGLVNLHPRNTSVAAINALPRPYPTPRTRSTVCERRAWRVKAQIVQFKLEGDSDIHLVLFWAGRYMIAEMPFAGCLPRTTRDRRGDRRGPREVCQPVWVSDLGLAAARCGGLCQRRRLLGHRPQPDRTRPKLLRATPRHGVADRGGLPLEETSRRPSHETTQSPRPCGTVCADQGLRDWASAKVRCGRRRASQPTAAVLRTRDLARLFLVSWKFAVWRALSLSVSGRAGVPTDGRRGLVAG
jgi:hypothetical protein